MAENIGFVGVGRMGSNMARRLKESGYPIAAVYDVNAAVAQSLAQELGCEACADLRQVTKLSDAIITVVTDDKAMKKIYTGGLLSPVSSQTDANSRVLRTDGEDMQNREHSCFFSAAHAAKDSGIALKLSKQAGLNLPLAAATRKQYDRMVKEGLGELDKSGIAELTFTGRHQK